MISLLNDCTVLDDEDAIRMAHGRYAMRDENRGASVHYLLEALRIRSSVSVSTLDRASSRIRIAGFRRMARAIAVRCF